jgi:ribosome modulation factor
MTTPNQRRWRSIKAMARGGPAHAMSIWSGRVGRYRRAASSGLPDAILRHFDRMVKDAAIAVKTSRAICPHPDRDLNDPDSSINRSVRSGVASMGHELTPMQLVNERIQVFATMRRGMADSGTPCPDDDQAMLEWVWFVRDWSQSETEA